MTTPYLIRVDGCDDSTKVIMRLHPKELNVAKAIANEVTAHGGGCAPTMTVYSVEASKDEYAGYADFSTDTFYDITKEIQ